MPTRGITSMFGHDIASLNRQELMSLRQKIGVVFQEFRLLSHMSAFDNVALPLRIKGTPEKQIKKDVEELLEWVGLGDHKHSLPPTMSGGQQQRIAVARAIITRPSLLLADEPTGNLDDEMGFKLLNLFEQLNKMGTTILIATHSQYLMDKFGHPIMRLNNGNLNIEKKRSTIKQKLKKAF